MSMYCDALNEVAVMRHVTPTLFSAYSSSWGRYAGLMVRRSQGGDGVTEMGKVGAGGRGGRQDRIFYEHHAGLGGGCGPTAVAAARANA